MNISMSGHHYQITEATRAHVEAGAAKLEKFYSPIIEFRIVLTKDANRYQAEVDVHVQGHRLVASNEGEKVFPAIDGALEKMERQLKKLHDKRRKPRNTPPPVPHEQPSEE